MSRKFYDKMFTESVKRVQEHYGSRKGYARFEKSADTPVVLGDFEKDFIQSRDSFYLATVNESGQPYIQFRGGPIGFLKVLDDRTLGYADFRGNLQYISVGNLASNNKAALILMDYVQQQRLKVLATVEVKDAAEAGELMQRLENPGYKAKVERAMILRVEAFDWNCPQHITPRFTIDEIRQITAPVYERLEILEAENSRLKQ